MRVKSREITRESLGVWSFRSQGPYGCAEAGSRTQLVPFRMISRPAKFVSWSQSSPERENADNPRIEHIARLQCLVGTELSTRIKPLRKPNTSYARSSTTR